MTWDRIGGAMDGRKEERPGAMAVSGRDAILAHQALIADAELYGEQLLGDKRREAMEWIVYLRRAAEHIQCRMNGDKPPPMRRRKYCDYENSALRHRQECNLPEEALDLIDDL